MEEDYLYEDYDVGLDDSEEYAEYYVDEDYDAMQESSWDDGNMEMGEASQMTLTEVVNYCVIPTTTSSFPHLLGVFTWPLLLLISLKIIRFPKPIIHILSGILGFVYIYQVFSWRIKFIFGLVAQSWISLVGIHFMLGKLRGPICFLMGISYIVVCELWLVEQQAWHAIRGVQMVILMKVTSIGFDVDSKKLKSLPKPYEIAGYIMHPGTVIFGPWVSFTNYSEFASKMVLNWKFVANLIMKLALCLIYLLMSTCFLNWIFFTYTNKFILAYKDALSFRTSHYFVSYISEISSSLAGIDAGTVSRPLSIELPRSLVEVVIFWNIPMHQWLKTYVFKTSKKNLGSAAALMFTYMTSSVFHGVNFQLAAVLLSLGFYTYTEFVLRAKLANIMNSCILSRKCGSDCSHKYKESTFRCRFINVAFGMMAMFHLAYLGMMFDSSTSQDRGYDMTHTLNKWGELRFSSHWLALICYVVMSVI